MNQRQKQYEALAYWMKDRNDFQAYPDEFTWKSYREGNSRAFIVQVLPNGQYRITIQSPFDSLIKDLDAQEAHLMMCGDYARGYLRNTLKAQELWDITYTVGSECFPHIKMLWEMASLARNKGFQVYFKNPSVIEVFSNLGWEDDYVILARALPHTNLYPEDEDYLWLINSDEGRFVVESGQEAFNKFVEACRFLESQNKVKEPWSI